VLCRELDGRKASPTAAVIDSQSIKSAEKGGRLSIRLASMQERRSRARNGISFSTLQGSFFTHLFIRRIFRIATAGSSFWEPLLLDCFCCWATIFSFSK
jgi:hypothetical protein